jgi:PPOX class probable F420-dependent enzyme
MPVVPESHRYLLGADVLTLATVGADGRPQVSVVWFIADAAGGDATVRVSLNDSRQKVKNLRANPACTVLILDTADPRRYVEIRGDAAIAPDDEYAFAGTVGAKYGADLRAFDGPGARRLVLTIVPTKVNAVDVNG